MITIVIPTYNRPLHLERALQFYKFSNLTYSIIIADSSDDLIKATNQKIIEKYSNFLSIILNNTFESSIFFPVKLHEALKQVTTPYAVFAPDDDFIFLEGLKKCFIFLEESQHYSVAQGIHYGFTFSSENSNPSFFMMDPIYKVRSIEENEASERLKNVLTLYTTTFYGVYRTPLLKKIIYESKIYTQEVKFQENFCAALSVIYGKVKYMQVPYLMRELSDSSVGAANENSIWVNRPDFNFLFDRFVEGIVKHLHSDINQNKKITIAYVHQYTSFFINASKSLDIGEKLKRYNSFRSFVPNFIYQFMKKIKKYLLTIIYRKRYTACLYNRKLSYYADLQLMNALIKEGATCAFRKDHKDFFKI